MMSAVGLRDRLTANRAPDLGLTSNVYYRFNIFRAQYTAHLQRGDFNSKIFAKFVSIAALGITYCYKNNIGLMGLIKKCH